LEIAFRLFSARRYIKLTFRNSDDVAGLRAFRAVVTPRDVKQSVELAQAAEVSDIDIAHRLHKTRPLAPAAIRPLPADPGPRFVAGWDA
jgi:hypothetical protein